MCCRANPNEIPFFFFWMHMLCLATHRIRHAANFKERKSALFTTQILFLSHLQVGGGNCCQFCFFDCGQSTLVFCTTTNTYQICKTTFWVVLGFFVFLVLVNEHQLKAVCCCAMSHYTMKKWWAGSPPCFLLFGRQLWKRPHRALTFNFISKIKLYFMLDQITGAAHVS